MKVALIHFVTGSHVRPTHRPFLADESLSATDKHPMGDLRDCNGIFHV